MTRCTAWATLALTVASGGSAHAQSSDAAEARARELVSEASVAYGRGHHHVALAAYTRAYELVPAPGLLFNLAQCHRELGQYGPAVAHYERYLEARPDAPNRALAESLLAESREAHEREDEQDRLREATEELALAREALEAVRIDLNVAAATPPIYETWWLWTIVTSAAIVIGIGVGLGIHLGQPGLPSGSLGTIDGR